MAQFSKYEPKLRKWEGEGYYDKPTDAGGPTKDGVTLTTFRMFFGEDKTVDDLKAMLPSQWKKIMKGGFWDKCCADDITNQYVAEIFVDWCVNCGIGMVRKVQALVGTTVDGKVGTKTVAAINSCNQRALHYRIKRARIEYYLSLVERNGRELSPRATILPFNIANIDGWIRRTASFIYEDGKK